ncbi:MAG: MFS transporter [Clostridia bacterium]|nr:MFS transporter [Clostridia bacterium]
MDKKLKLSRAMYNAEAALEYLISILVGTSFLATLTKNLGISDSVTGIVTSFISLGALFQLFSMFIQRKKMKNFVIVLSIINQLLFLSLYVIPLSFSNKPFKGALFIIAIFTAYIVYYTAHPKKLTWMMSLVQDNERGRFTANKEIISLLVGMIFQFTMSAVIDAYAQKGEIKTAFIISAVVIFVIMILHTISMFLTVEPDIPQPDKQKLSTTIRDTFSNKNVLKVAFVLILYHVSNFSTSFYGTYQISELGFSLKFISIVHIVGSFVRMFVSRFWGRYADRHSFAVMMEKCFIFFGLSFLCFMFATPSNGKIMVLLYYIFHYISMGGISSGTMNLVFDYADPDKRANSLAVCQAFSGALGSLTTIATSPLLAHIQNNGNTFLGFNIYGQQLFSFISFTLIIIAIIYTRKTFIKNKNML